CAKIRPCTRRAVRPVTRSPSSPCPRPWPTRWVSPTSSWAAPSTPRGTG
ncbi:MAG: hypothetical protein AVDCRST_MAG66-1247, partial [uncultured Pseudonocardia sp.]